MTAQIKRTGCGIERLASFRFLIVVFLALILAGCGDDPGYRLVWSADGKRAIVFASDGVRLTDGEGDLSKVVLDHADHVVWLPDGKSFIAITSKTVTSWEELKKFLSRDEQQGIIESAGKLEQFIATKGNPFDEKFSKHMSKEDEKTLDEIMSKTDLGDLLVYLSSIKSDLMGANKSDATSTIFSLSHYRLQNESLKEPSVLYQTTHKIESVAVSPSGTAIALVETINDDCKLLAIQITGGSPTQVAQSITKYADWLDARNVAYIKKTTTADNMSLGSLQQATVLKENGSFENEIKPEVLAATTYDDSARVQCEGGRVFFSSAQFSIPCDPNSVSAARRIYMVEPGRLASVIAVTSEKYAYKNGEDCNVFEASPNGMSIAVLKSNGHVDVIDTADGDWQEAQDQSFPEKQNKSFLPQWRSKDELCFAVPVERKDEKSEPTNKRIAEVVLWSPGKKEVKTISKKWPAEAVHFLEKEEEKKKDDKNDTPKSQ